MLSVQEGHQSHSLTRHRSILRQVLGGCGVVAAADDILLLGRISIVPMPAEGERLLLAADATTTVALVVVHHGRVAVVIGHVDEVEVAVDVRALVVSHLLHVLLALLPRGCIA